MTAEHELPGPADFNGPRPVHDLDREPKERDRIDDRGPGRDLREEIDIEEDQAKER
jgi:hypothetical protein